jgi:hypothetical protein
MQVVWFIVNIVLPMALPTIGAFAVMLIPPPAPPAPPPPSLGTAVVATVKDGQLAWGVVAMGLSTIYEFLEALMRPAPGRVTFLIGVAVLGAAVMMAFAMLLAGVGANFPIPPRVGAAVPFFRYYKALTMSLVMALVGAVSFTFVHFTYS